jgi:hypothetical protein
MNENLPENIEWNSHHENILVDWADKALVYKWLHSKSEKKYSWLTKLFTIPVIIMSTLTGTANFAIDRIPEEWRNWYQIAVGSTNIFAGIITTISQFLKINELSEAHRVACISWDKYYRNIRVELIKSPSERTDVGYVIKSSKDEFDRLMESSPSIDDSIVKLFYKTCSGGKIRKDILTDKQEKFTKLTKPEICDVLTSTRDIVYKPSEDDIEQNEANKLIKIIKQKQDLFEKQCEIDTFVTDFTNQYSRRPTVEEIYDNLSDDIDNNIINKYINSAKWLNRDKK